MTNFSEKVYSIVKQIPYGQTMTYGEVAHLAGNPLAARTVGNILHRNPDPATIPCHRVVNARGEVSRNYAFGGGKAQKRKLDEEKSNNLYQFAIKTLRNMRIIFLSCKAQLSRRCQSIVR